MSEREAPQRDPDAASLLEGEGAEQAATDQFMHGLLAFMHIDDEERQGRRIRRLMASIDDEARPTVLATLRQPVWRRAGAAAACLLFAFALVYLLIPTQQSAYAVVQASIDAAREAGDRRYEVTVRRVDRDEQFEEPIAVLDLRGEGQVLLRADTPEGHQLIVGSNDDGRWAIRRDGGIERFRPERAWPRWINLGQSTVLLEPVDDLLERLDGHYRLARQARERLDDDSEQEYERLSAELIDRHAPDPQRIDLWIDVDTHLVHRLELGWPDRHWPGRGSESRPEGAGEMGPGHRDRPLPREMGPPGAMPPPELRPRLDQPPRFLEGPPRFGEGAAPVPPELVVFQLVESDEFPADWFDPERHVE